MARATTVPVDGPRARAGPAVPAEGRERFLRRPLAVTAPTALVMVTVEVAQAAPVTGPAFDVDDVLLNTTGALLSCLLLGRRLGVALHARRD